MTDRGICSEQLKQDFVLSLSKDKGEAGFSTAKHQSRA